MKKLIIITMLLLGTIVYSQESFTKTYTKCLITKNEIKEPMLDLVLTVVFNYQNSKLIKIYFADGDPDLYQQISEMSQGETVGGYKYQYIEILDTKNGNELALQLFEDDDILRLLLKSGDSIEFYK